MRLLAKFVLALAIGTATFGGSSPAPAMTCMINNDTLDEVVCGTIKQVAPHAAFLCSKYRICFG